MKKHSKHNKFIKKQYLATLLVVIAMVMVVGTKAALTYAATISRPLTLTAGSNGQTVTLHKGSNLATSLQAIYWPPGSVQGSGMLASITPWSGTKASNDKILKPNGSEHQYASKNADNSITYTTQRGFRANKVGKTTITAVTARYWRCGPDILCPYSAMRMNFTVTVVVKP